MDQTIKYNLWINGFNVHWVRTRLEKRKGSVMRQRYFRKIKNIHSKLLSEGYYYLNNEND